MAGVFRRRYIGRTTCVIKILPEQLRANPRLELHHQQILNYIHERGSITQREYGDISDRSLAARKLDFEKLIRLKLIEANGVGRGTFSVTINIRFWSLIYYRDRPENISV